MESHSGTAERRETHTVSRWSPTKEQIAILENLYKQGIRTPNTEQIQQITSTLKAYGHIQGKNVFYWFQNHKARLRQKLKQNQQSFLNLSHPTSQNVVCSPYYSQQGGINFYPQQPNAVATGVISSRIVPFGIPRTCERLQIYKQFRQCVPDYNASTSNREALTLFPLHPTGILKEKPTKQVPFRASLSVDVTDISLVASTAVDVDCHLGNQPFFDFFTSELRS